SSGSAMNYSKFTLIAVAATVLVAAAPVDAGAQHRGGHGGGGAVVGRAAPRVASPRVYGGGRVGYSPRILGYAPYRPYYYGYRPGITLGFYAGYGYPYGYSYYGYPYYSGYYPYAAYGYGGYGYGGYGYPLPPAGYVSAQPGVAYGGVRIQ